jgi:hypothetical protein
MVAFSSGDIFLTITLPIAAILTSSTYVAANVLWKCSWSDPECFAALLTVFHTQYQWLLRCVVFFLVQQLGGRESYVLCSVLHSPLVLLLLIGWRNAVAAFSLCDVGGRRLQYVRCVTAI